MVIKQIFNNNVVLAKNSSKDELVAMGCGIAFKKKVGDKINENSIEKTFILKQKDASEKFKLLLEDIPAEHVSICYDIIEYAKNMLDIELNDYIYVTLTDHISYALKLNKDGIKRSNVLMWEIKKFYPKEFKIGLRSLDLDEDSLNYERFVTYLRFFFKRLNNKNVLEEEDDFLLEQVKDKYKKAYECMLKVEKYLGQKLSQSEKLYLTLHIQRVTAR